MSSCQGERGVSLCKGFGRFFEKKLGKKLSNGYYFELLSKICALDL